MHKETQRKAQAAASGGDEAIEFAATIAQVRTLADGGIRLTLDLPEDAIAEAAMLMAWRRESVTLAVMVQPEG